MAVSIPLSGNPQEVLEEARAKRRAGDLVAAANFLADSIAALGLDGSAGACGSAASLHRELGEVLLEQNLAAEACEQFELALRLAPGEGVVHYQAGLAYRMAGNEPLAAGHLRQAVNAGFATVAAYLHLSAAEFASGNLSGGLEASRVLLGMQPRSVPVLMRVGHSLFERFFYEDALRAFEAALVIDSGSYEARHFTALTSHLLNRYANAVSALAGLEPDQFTAESSSLMASALAQQGRTAEAEEKFRDAVRRWPNSPHALLNWALLLLERDRIGEAETRLAALKRHPSVIAPKVFFSVQRNSCPQVAADSGRPRATGLDRPLEADAFVELAATLAARQHHRTAVELLRLAQANRGNSPQVLLSLAYSCLHIDPAGKAPVALLERALKGDPALAEAHHLLGRAHLRQGRRDAAIRSHRAAVGLETENSRYHTELGRALAEGSDEADRVAAAESFVHAADLDPRNAVARYELGKLLIAMKRYEEAILVLKEAAALEPEFHSPYYQLGLACLRAGYRDEATRYLGKFALTRATAEARSSAGAGFAGGL